ncbi:MAG: hypothetical protein AAB358_02340 [Patescibacteria group bacterium]
MDKENKINFGGEEEYFALAEITKEDFFSFDYLLASARNGRLKAFKFGDDWFTTKSWVHDFKNKIRNKVEAEIGERHSEKWVEHFKKRRGFFRAVWQTSKPILNFQLEQRFAAISLVLFFLFCLSGLTVSFARVDEKFNLNRAEWGEKFVLATDAAYGLPWQLAEKGSILYLGFFNQAFSGLTILENNLDQSILAVGDSVGVDPKRLAGFFSGEKIYDERITEYFQEFLKKLGFAAGQGEVAGESESLE